MTVLKSIFKDRIFQISLVIIVISLFFARPRMADINLYTLYSVTTTPCLIQIYAYLRILDILVYKLTSLVDNIHKLTLLFILLPVLPGMFLGNGTTVLTLIPLYLNTAKKYQLPQIYPAALISMEVGIGTAFTLWGNPHNVLTVSNYNMPADIFFAWSAPYLTVSLVILIATCFFLPKDHVPVNQAEDIHVSRKMTILTTAAFIPFLFGVFPVVPIYCPMIATLLLALLINPRIYLKIDYALLLTFTLLFILISDIQ